MEKIRHICIAHLRVGEKLNEKLCCQKSVWRVNDGQMEWKQKLGNQFYGFLVELFPELESFVDVFEKLVAASVRLLPRRPTSISY